MKPFALRHMTNVTKSPGLKVSLWISLTSSVQVGELAVTFEGAGALYEQKCV